MNDSALNTLSAVDARRLIASRQVSPVELMDACLAQIAAINPAVNALAATRFDQARSDARAAEQAVMRGDALGLLHGLPLGVKDLEETAGLLTTYGSPMFRANVPSQDNALVARLRGAGAILTAKTNTPEMGAGANTRNAVWGATGNPFDPALNAGGSSGGSAVALATDMLPLCTGSDTGGSLRIPAAYCGVVGFRPSPGLVPGDTRWLGWSPLIVSGPMGRSVADTRLQLAAMVGLHGDEPLGVECDFRTILRARDVDLSTLRIGFTEDFGVCDVSNDVRETFRAKMASLSRFVRVCEPVAFDLGDVDRCFDVMRAQSFIAGFKDIYERDPTLLGANTRTNYEMGLAMSMGDAVWAHAEQTRIFRRFQAAYAHYDLIVSPTCSVSPFPWQQLYLAEMDGRPLENYYRWLGLTYVVSLLTNPALSLPCGVDHAGMPFGIQLVGPFRGDRRVLDIAQALESAFSDDDAMRRPVPDLGALRNQEAMLKAIVTEPADAGLARGG
ncbi:amidase family protein [Paraburkholderia sp.]|uniref:amidase n=1 Tax=Paraburkholderia sp. TaxID=1926495 RepID=UPI0023987749|nr:amidase family protein [Paraburkholderia sp.]MDE1182183.1 amidase family protein [Paraburkholderia sp.]